jgi:hypothetical protein
MTPQLVYRSIWSDLKPNVYYCQFDKSANKLIDDIFQMKKTQRLMLYKKRCYMTSNKIKVVIHLRKLQ